MQIDPAKLVEARLARAMSQEEAAIAADLSARTIQRIEAGQPASLESTKALLTIFGADIICDPLAQPGSELPSPWRYVSGKIADASRRSASIGFDGLRALFAINFLLVAVTKPFRPGETGLFIDGDGFAIGAFSQSPAGASELLGYWIMPVMLLAAIAMALSIGRVRARFQLSR